MSLKIPFWQVVTYANESKGITYEVLKSVILNGKIITHLDPHSSYAALLIVDVPNIKCIALCGNSFVFYPVYYVA